MAIPSQLLSFPEKNMSCGDYLHSFDSPSMVTSEKEALESLFKKPETYLAAFERNPEGYSDKQKFSEFLAGQIKNISIFFNFCTERDSQLVAANAALLKSDLGDKLQIQERIDRLNKR
jgi:hypothetical protein